MILESLYRDEDNYFYSINARCHFNIIFQSFNLISLKRIRSWVMQHFYQLSESLNFVNSLCYLLLILDLIKFAETPIKMINFIIIIVLQWTSLGEVVRLRILYYPLPMESLHSQIAGCWYLKLDLMKDFEINSISFS